MKQDEPEIRIPKFNVVERGTISYDSDKVTVEPSPPTQPPVDDAAVEAERVWLNTSAVGDGKLARIITTAYAAERIREQPQDARDAVCLVMTDVFFDEVAKNEAEHDRVFEMLCQRISDCLTARLSAEQAVREKLVEALDKLHSDVVAWNSSVEQIIGRRPQTNIALDGAVAALASAEALEKEDG